MPRPPLELDHLVVTGPTLAEAVARVEAALGVVLEPGGRHAHMATHNRLLALGPGVYLEVIAPEPATEAPRPDWPRWFRLDERGGVGLTNWVARSGNLDAALAGAPAGAGQATELVRGALSWRMGVPADGRLPHDDCYPGLIQWLGTTRPTDLLPESGCRLKRLRVIHPEAAELLLLLPVADARLVIERGDTPALVAEIATPQGLCILGPELF